MHSINTLIKEYALNSELCASTRPYYTYDTCIPSTPPSPGCSSYSVDVALYSGWHTEVNDLQSINK